MEENRKGKSQIQSFIDLYYKDYLKKCGVDCGVRKSELPVRGE